MMAKKDLNNYNNRLRIVLSTLVCCLLLCLAVSAGNHDSYTVSVYQSRVTVKPLSNTTREAALAHMNVHLYEYEIEAEEAAKRKSQILVFPEYGLYADIKKYSRDSMINFLEKIPDPKVHFPWTPCDLENSKEDITVQKNISCMAKKNNLYIVANVGEIETCNRTLDYRCPRDGRYQFNTNVVYAPNGTLVSRYRKKHLFHEPHFNAPSVAEHEVFDTPFGRFATIVCFDIYFSDTLHDLIESKGVRNIIFPNMWFNTPPLFISASYHASIAWATNINLISANLIVDKTVRTGGSGFYNGMSGDFSYSFNQGLLTANMTSIKSDTAFRFSKVPKRQTPCPGNQSVFTHTVGDIESKFIRLIEMKGSIGVCHYEFCCGLEYEFESKPEEQVSYWLSATNFIEFEACAVCTVFGDKHCESLPVDNNVQFVRFKQLRLFANDFQRPFVFPQVIAINGTFDQVLDPSSYYSKGEINLSKTLPLHTVALLNRIYPAKTSGSTHSIISLGLLIGLLLLCLL